jgi:hypothetical protein
MEHSIIGQAIVRAFEFFDRNKRYWDDERVTTTGEEHYQRQFLKRVQYERRVLTGTTRTRR